MFNFLISSLLLALLSTSLLSVKFMPNSTYRRAYLIGQLFWSRWLSVLSAVCCLFMVATNLATLPIELPSFLKISSILTTAELVTFLVLCAMLFTSHAGFVSVLLLAYLSFRLFGQSDFLANSPGSFNGMILLMACLSILTLLSDRLPWSQTQRDSLTSPLFIRKLAFFCLFLFTMSTTYRAFIDFKDFLDYSQNILRFTLTNYQGIVLLSVTLLLWIAATFLDVRFPIIMALPVPSLIFWCYGSQNSGQLLLIPLLSLLAIIASPYGAGKKSTLLG